MAHDTDEGLVAEVERIGRRVAARPWLDGRTQEEILGYDERGVPE